MDLNTFTQIYLFVMGAVVGSFLNVVIHRVPLDESIVKPGSHCPKCKTPIRIYDNIPIFSWFILRGRCRDCGEKFSIRYMLVELIAAVLIVILYQFYSLSWELVHYAVLTLILLASSLVDYDYQIIPNSFVLTGLVLGVLLVGIAGTRDIVDALMGGLVMGGFLFLIGLVGEWALHKEALGFGDIKFALMIGIFIGWKHAVLALFLSAVFASIFGISAILARKLEFGRPFPFGPFIAAASLVSAFWGDLLISLYLTWAFGGGTG